MPGTAAQSPADARRVAIASAIGTTIEWYDFFICVHCRYSWAIRRLGVANTVSCERGACGGRLVFVPKPRSKHRLFRTAAGAGRAATGRILTPSPWWVDPALG